MGRHAQTTRIGGGSTLGPDESMLTVVQFPVADATVISSGDLVYWDSASKKIKPFSSLPDQGSKVNNQVLAASLVCGVALAAHANGGGDTNIPVQFFGPAQLQLVSATVHPGDLVGPTPSAGTWPLSNTKLEVVISTDLAIGRSTSEGTAQTSVLAYLWSTRMTGGVQPES